MRELGDSEANDRSATSRARSFRALDVDSKSAGYGAARFEPENDAAGWQLRNPDNLTGNIVSNSRQKDFLEVANPTAGDTTTSMMVPSDWSELGAPVVKIDRSYPRFPSPLDRAIDGAIMATTDELRELGVPVSDLFLSDLKGETENARSCLRELGHLLTGLATEESVDEGSSSLERASKAIEGLSRVFDFANSVDAFSSSYGADLRQSIVNLRGQVDRIEAKLAAGEPAPPSLLRRTLVAGVRVIAITVVSSVVVGPISAFITHAALIEKSAEAFVSGFVGAASAEAAIAVTNRFEKPEPSIDGGCLMDGHGANRRALAHYREIVDGLESHGRDK